MTATDDFIKAVPDEGSYESSTAPWPAELRVFKEEGRIEIDFSDGRAYSYRGFNRPGSILVTEAFLIEGDKIRRVEMIGPAAVYHMNSPWGGLSGN